MLYQIGSNKFETGRRKKGAIPKRSVAIAKKPLFVRDQITCLCFSAATYSGQNWEWCYIWVLLCPSNVCKVGINTGLNKLLTPMLHLVKPLELFNAYKRVRSQIQYI